MKNIAAVTLVAGVLGSKCGAHPKCTASTRKFRGCEILLGFFVANTKSRLSFSC